MPAISRSLSGTGPRLATPLLALMALLLPAAEALSFKVGIHEDMTEAVLTAQGFDAESADEVGDSNYYTDFFEASSEAAHADNNRLGAASLRLIQKRTQIGDALDQCRRREALDAFGEALHTVQDIFAHSNAVDNGHPVDLLSLVDGTAPCDPARNFAPGGLVTGYFSVGGFFTGNQCRGKPATMCCHRELNKDNASQPNGARHPAARAAAEAATVDYLRLVEDDIRARFAGDRATQLIKMLKRRQRTTMFVIDDTGSMFNDIAGVKAAANAFLDRIVAGAEAPTLGLVTFKDNVSNRGLTCNIDQLRAQINGLFASGGGDCPEAMNSALLSALRTFPTGRSDIQLRGGRILLATDASARDPQLGPFVASEALSRGIGIDAILTGDCVAETPFTEGDDVGSSSNGPGEDPEPGAEPPATEAVEVAASDPLTSPSARTYLRALAERTGGVLFNVGRLEVDDVVPTLLELGDPATTVLLTQRAQPAPGAPATVELVVDDGFPDGLTFMVTSSTAAGLPAVTLFRPDGRPVQFGDPDASLRRLSSVATFTMQAPAAGVWRVQLEGGASALVRAFGTTPFHLVGLRLFEPTGLGPRAEPDLPQLKGQPVIGSSVVAEVRFTQAPLDASLRLRRLDGTLIQELAAVLDGRRVRGTLAVPEETFLIEVSGRTPTGSLFVRRLSVPVTPRAVGIAVTPDVASVPAGQTAAFEVVVRNAGTVAATYRLELSASRPWPATLPGTFAVEPGASVTLPVRVAVPAGTAEGTRNDLTLRVQDVAVASNNNFTGVAVVVAPPNRPPDCSGARPTLAQLWPPNHKLVEVGIDGLSDPDGDVLAVTIDAITQDEPVCGRGAGRTSPDGAGVGGPVAQLRAERLGGDDDDDDEGEDEDDDCDDDEGEDDDDDDGPRFDGRVYAVSFSVSDGKGGQCQGSVTVDVPLCRRRPAVDSGQVHDSTRVCPRRR